MAPLLADGFNLALYGIGTVFLFLTMLVFATTIMSRIVSVTTTNTPKGKEISSIKIAAISAAIHQHRKK